MTPEQEAALDELVRLSQEMGGYDTPTEQEEPHIEGIVTSCRDCIFAETSGDEQIGCAWDRLEAFEENGAEVVGQDDGTRRYFLVVGRFCNACRNWAWGEKHPPKDWHGIVAKEFQARVNLMIYVDADATMADVEKSLDSAIDQGPVSPRGVTIILNAPAFDTREYIKLIRRKNLEIPWEVRKIVPDADHGYRQPDYGQAVDLAVTHLRDTTFYGIARAGYEWPPNYLSVINDAINYQMVRAVALLPDDDGNGLLMGVDLHSKFLHGNRGKDVLDKLFEVAAEEQTGHMIKTWDDLRDSID